MIFDKTKNIFWINAVKALCIIAVYFVHCEIYYGFGIPKVNDIIHPLYVNGFFFVSGFLMMRKQLSSPLSNQSVNEYINGGGKKLLTNIIYKLAIPTMLFSLMEYMPKKLLRGEQITLHSFFSNTIGGGTYWFTSALVVAELIVLLILITRWKSLLTYFIMGLVTAALGWYLIQIDFHLFGFGRDPWAYRRGLLAVAFMMAGGVYWRYEEQLAKRMNLSILSILLCVYIIIFGLYPKEFPVLISTMDITFAGYLASLLGCIVLVEICKKMKEIKVLTFIGQYSLCFYFLSGALPMIVTMIAKRFLPVGSFGVLLVIFLSCLMLAAFVTYVLNKYLPFLFDLRKMNLEISKDRL